MSNRTKSKLYKMLDDIEDEETLNQLMEEVAFYKTKKDVVDKLTADQLNELDEAIKEVENKETVTWEEFKKEMNEWKRK